MAEEGEAASHMQGREPFEKQAAEETRRTRTGRKKPGWQAIQRPPSGDRPPPVMTWTCG